MKRNYLAARLQNKYLGLGNGRDSLTGIWNERCVKMRVIEKMHENGSLFLCDIDHLRKINERFGHLEGDECLKRTVQILGYMTEKEDILGRIGGDEFVIFMPGCKSQEAAEEKEKRIENRFLSEKRKDENEVNFSVTVAHTLRREGDTWQSMLARARKEFCEKKARGISGGYSWKPDNYRKDIKRIREDLTEQINKPGAYCQDYKTFQSVYRFLERGIVRSGQKACVILFSMVDEKGKILPPREKDALMKRLGEDICSELRIGDIYTQYSSSQYLVLVIDTTEKIADTIADRINEKFQENVEKSSLLIHYCYALRPVRMPELLKGSEA